MSAVFDGTTRLGEALAIIVCFVDNWYIEKNVSAVFDGTTRLGEALAIIVCFVDNWYIMQCLIPVQMLVKTMNSMFIAY